MSDLPRILFITNEAPQTGAAGSIILFRLFKEYPADRLLVVTNSLQPSGSDRLSCRYEFLQLKLDLLKNTRFSEWRFIMRSLGASRLLGTSGLESLLVGFVPDVVVTVMQDSWYYDFAAKMAQRLRKPLIVFGHDLSHTFEPLPVVFRRRQLARDREFLTQCAVKLCVSEGMVRFFQQEFGVSSSVLYPPRSAHPINQSPELCRSLKTSGRLTIGFTGGLHYGYGQQLLEMLPIFRETRTFVEVFSPMPTASLDALKEASDVFKFNGYLSPPEAASLEILQRCDVLIQPYLMNPPENCRLHYQTHFPSKLGDYLSMGIPLLITGPPDASGMAWCLEHSGSALCVTDPNPAALRHALQLLKKDQELRVDIARGAQSLAREHFSLGALQTQLRNHLVKAVMYY
jgi:glycosyltransferase involved in cell wall biosynthesis